jgi:tRNA(Ile2) C34 agmatinyltransferase TiaS
MNLDPTIICKLAPTDVVQSVTCKTCGVTSKFYPLGNAMFHKCTNCGDTAAHTKRKEELNAKFQQLGGDDPQ